MSATSQRTSSPAVASVGVETQGIAPVPADRRYGRPARLFSLWFAPNLNVTVIFTGALSITTGLDFVSAASNHDLLIVDGRRQSTATAYLEPVIDLRALLSGVRQALEISEMPAFDHWRAGSSPLLGADDATLTAFVREAVQSYGHAAGSCRMGVDSLAVVDPRLRVHGLDRLRIADASVMPTIVSTNTNAATVMIAEKAADLLQPMS